MEYDLARAALYIVAAVLFYAVLARGLFNVTETFRWRALEMGEQLIHSPQVSDERKEAIYFRLGEVYSAWNAWKLVFMMVCVVFTLPFRGARDYNATGVPPSLRADHKTFSVYWMIATVGNSPAAAFLFSLMVTIFLAFFASVSAISTALVSARDRHDHHDHQHHHA
jgi:hypothetical protein